MKRKIFDIIIQTSFMLQFLFAVVSLFQFHVKKLPAMRNKDLRITKVKFRLGDMTRM